jgi:pimeloyl-ACP methyl ester carboxylesterase
MSFDASLLRTRPAVRESAYTMRLICTMIFLMVISITVSRAEEPPLGEHGFAQSGDTRIHYVTAGKGPLLVMIHGFPDYWYTWRNQMPELAKTFQIVAIDQRGYNRSDQPVGVENYTMPKLVGDVKAVINHFGRNKAVVLGHDWGGAVAWSFAMAHPEMVDRLVILNLPHLNGLQRELATNPEQQKASAYARNFQTPEAASRLTAAGLAFWVKDPEAKSKYIEAFKRSSFEGMLNYYKANYPKPPYRAPTTEVPKVQCPVLLIHGLADTALLPGALNDTWQWLDNDLTLVTIPKVDHFVQHAAADKVTHRISSWLNVTTAGK